MTDYRRITDTWRHSTPHTDSEIRLETETGLCAEARVAQGREPRYWLWQITRSPASPSAYASTLLGCEEGPDGYVALRQLGAYVHHCLSHGIEEPSLGRRARAMADRQAIAGLMEFPCVADESGGAR